MAIHISLEEHVRGRSREIIEIPMKARVFVSLKSTVLDPQGQTVCSALHGLGYPAIAAVRQGKFFDIAIGEGVSREQAQKDVETIAHEVLANPVIEEYRVEIMD
jgi:phosphoribosylformylglycinamidine synthase subunit PurS